MSPTPPYSVVLAGGGSAGHISPALATADALLRAVPDIRLTFLGTERGLESRLVPAAGFELRTIPPVPLPRTLTPALAGVPLRLAGAVRAARSVLADVGADAVVGFGGYVSLPAYLAAGRRTPVVVHEANARPGLANRIAARFAVAVACAVRVDALPRARVIGIPLRRSITGLDRAADRAAARAHFGLNPDRPTLLVTGGSQGARSINAAVRGAADALRAAGVQVLHVPGARNDLTAPVPGPVPYVVVPYLDRMESGYAAADLVLCRSGANTCAEVAAVGLPAVYVPLPIGNGEQRLNAGPIVAAGGGLLVDDAALTAEWVGSRLVELITDPAGLAAMAAAAQRSGHRDADEQLAAIVLGALGRRDPPASVPPVPVPEPAVPGMTGGTHFVGIGGIGMSGIARILLARGVPVSGSDAKDSLACSSLRALGARIEIGHRGANIGDAATVVVSTAIRPDNPEVVAARAAGRPVVRRAAALAAVMAGHRAVAITGTNGKTSTTSMLTVAAQHAGADPSFAIGGDLSETGANAHHGSGELFIAEADESDGSFLLLAPDAVVVTNIGVDHLDQHGTPEAYARSFTDFLDRVRPPGLLVACADDSGSRRLAEAARTRLATVLTYGEAPHADLQLADVTIRPDSTSYLARLPGGTHVRVHLAVVGLHQAMNSAAALLAGTALGLDTDRLVAGLAGYRGVRRRFEFKGSAAGIRVYDDYAHHPSKVAAQLRAARVVAGDGRLIAVFQPHLYSRTRSFAAGFGTSLALADEVVVTDVFGAREDPVPGVTGAMVADAVPASAAVHYAPVTSAVPELVAGLARRGDLVVTMGAGDITLLGPQILAAIAERSGR